MQEAQTSSTTPMRQNAQGHWVPENLIAPADKLRDEVVMGVIAAAREQRSQLAALKISSMQQINDFVDLSSEQYGVAWGGTKGNVTLLGFDGRYKLIRAVGEHRKLMNGSRLPRCWLTTLSGFQGGSYRREPGAIPSSAQHRRRPTGSKPCRRSPMPFR